jgi:hypothetical protein
MEMTMPNAKSIDLAQLSARAAKASAVVAKRQSLRPEKGIILDPTTLIGRLLREMATQDLSAIHESSIAITKQVSTPAGPALTPATYIQGDDILIGFIMRDQLELPQFNLG